MCAHLSALELLDGLELEGSRVAVHASEALLALEPSGLLRVDHDNVENLITYKAEHEYESTGSICVI